MKKTFKKYLLKYFLFSKVTDCKHATWLKINFFTTLQFFDLPFFRKPYWQLQLFIRGLLKIMKMHSDTVS